MLELEVVPERSLGCEQWEFILGMHFSQAVAIIQSQVGIIKGVQVLYSDTNPLGVDLIISLPQDGIRLIFDPVVQRLKIIEIYNMKLVKLKYCGLTFNSPEVLPSIEQIEHSFGATHPGVYDTEKQLFVLNFRGLSFCFPVESKFQLLADKRSELMMVTVPQQFFMQTGPKDIEKRFFVSVATLTEASVQGPARHGTNCGNPGYAHGLGSLQFPNGSSPVVSRTSVYTGNNLAESRSPALPLCCYHNHLYMERAEVLREQLHTTGIRLHLFTEGSSRLLEPRKQSLSCEVLFGDTCQDVATALGAPSRVFYKSEDKMKIHSPNAHRRVASRRSDFFYNYFTLGMDILFDAKTQKVKKFVLHTNFPGHYNFNMYHRCEFHLAVPPDLNRQPPSEAGQLIDVSPPGPIMISAYTKWDAISEQLKPSERPVVLNRASSTNTTNPFGSTFCYGYQDIIFEVMPNNYIASVTLYAGERSSPDV